MTDVHCRSACGEAERGRPRRGPGGDVTARPLTSRASGQESRSDQARPALCSECVPARVCVCTSVCPGAAPEGDVLALKSLHASGFGPIRVISKRDLPLFSSQPPSLLPAL